jgi:hypothetical protein
MKPRAFQIVTEEGSQFVARFDPQQTYGPAEFGRIQLIGIARSHGQEVRMQGLAAVPEPGGQILVSSEPIEWLETDGEPVPIYPKETIVQVTELALPEWVAPAAL